MTHAPSLAIYKGLYEKKNNEFEVIGRQYDILTIKSTYLIALLYCLSSLYRISDRSEAI